MTRTLVAALIFSFSQTTSLAGGLGGLAEILGGAGVMAKSADDEQRAQQLRRQQDNLDDARRQRELDQIEARRNSYSAPACRDFSYVMRGERINCTTCGGETTCR